MQETADNQIRTLIERYYDDVLKTARQFGMSATDAEDVAQRVFILASRKLDKIISGSERSFLFGTTMRVAGDVRRSAAVRREVATDELDPSQTGPNADSIVDQLRAREMLDRMIQLMPEELRQVFVLYEVEELTMAQISETLGLAAGTVASRLRRSREWFEQAVLAQHRPTEAPKTLP